MADKTVFTDLQKLAGDAFVALNSLGTNAKAEIESLVQRRVESLMNKANMVSREEYEVVRDMAQKARLENQELSERLAVLEKNLSPPIED